MIALNKVLNTILITLFRCYQYFISPYLGKRCRFFPSCSEYAIHCFQKQSFFLALWNTVKRIFKCHPFHPGGLDEI